MLTGLNAEVASAASRHGWEFVGGITSQFFNHGYCAADHWVVRYRESRANQGDINGTLHPNGAGQNAYGGRIATRMRSALYVGGNLQQPRRPEQRLEVQGRRAAGGPFADVVGPVDPGETVTIRARVSGPDNAGQTVNFALQGPGSISPASAATDANGIAMISYLAPNPSQGEQARVIATMADANGTYRDTAGIVLVYREPTPTPEPTFDAGSYAMREYLGIETGCAPEGGACHSLNARMYVFRELYTPGYTHTLFYNAWGGGDSCFLAAISTSGAIEARASAGFCDLVNRKLYPSPNHLFLGQIDEDSMTFDLMAAGSDPSAGTARFAGQRVR
jgi:hypothetical protein